MADCDCWHCETMSGCSAHEQRDQLRAANAKLRAELAWYADRERYRHPDGNTYGEAHELIHYDLGRRARAALDADKERGA